MTTFNGRNLRDFCVIQDIERQIMPTVDLTLVDMQGRDGSYYFRKRKQSRVIKLSIKIIGETKDEIRATAKQLARYLDTEGPAELTFPDEPGIYYMAIVSGETTMAESPFIADAEITFLCPDPHGYAFEVQTVSIPPIGAFLENQANEKAYPTYTATFNGPATFFAMVNPEGTVLIGSPEEIGKAKLPAKEQIFFDDANDLTQWAVNTNVPVENGVATGAVQAINSLIRPTSYGTGTSWHGPAIKASFPQLLQDFQIDLQMSISGSAANQLGQLELLMLDQNNTAIGAMRTRDASYAYDHPKLQWRAGDLTTNKSLLELEGPSIGYYADSSLLLRVIRKGTTWTVYSHKYVNGKVVRPYSKVFNFKAGQFDLKKLAAISIFFGAYQANPPLNLISLERVTVWKLNTVTEVQTPVIFQAGDVLEIDTYNATATINGETAMQLDPASVFSPIKPGETEVKWLSDDIQAATVTATYKERWK